jgi:hypothetical protein
MVASWRGMLYGVQPQDPTTINLIAVGLTAAALVACSLPAVKAVALILLLLFGRTSSKRVLGNGA